MVFSSNLFKRAVRFIIRMLLVTALLFILYHLVSVISFGFIRRNVKPIITQAYKQFNNGDIDSALVLFNQCARKSRFIGGDFYISESNFWIAKCHYLKNRRDLSQFHDYCMFSIMYGKDGRFGYLRNLKAVRSSYYLLAKYHLSTSNFKDAKEQYVKALEVSEKYKDIQGMMECLGMYGELFMKLNNWYSLLDITFDKLGKIEEKKLLKYGKEYALNLNAYYYFFVEAIPSFPEDMELKIEDLGVKGDTKIKDVYKDIDVFSSYSELVTIYSLKDPDNLKLNKQAISFQTDFLRVIKKYPDRSLVSSVILRVCELYLLSGEIKKVFPLLKKLESEDDLSDLDRIKIRILYAKAKQILGHGEESMATIEDVDSTANQIGPLFLLDSLALNKMKESYYGTWIEILEDRKDTTALYGKCKELIRIQADKKAIEKQLKFLGDADYFQYLLESRQNLFNKERKSNLATAFWILMFCIALIILGNLLEFAIKSLKEKTKNKVAEWILSTSYASKSLKGIKLLDIVYIQKKSNTDKIIFHLKSGEKLEEYNSLDELEYGEEDLKKLPEGIFIRTHQSFIINKSEVAEIPVGRSTLKMTNGDVVKVSRDKKKRVFELLESNADLNERAHVYAPKWYRFIDRYLPKDPEFFRKIVTKTIEFCRWIISKN